MKSKLSPLRPVATVRDVLGSRHGKVALLLAIVVLTAGCSATSGDDPETDPIDSVPADVDVVAQVDVAQNQSAAFAEELNGTGFVAGVNESERDGHGERWKNLIANDSQFDADAVERATAFARLPDGSGESDGLQNVYAGVIVETDLSWEEAVEVSDGELADAEERSQNGVPVYVVEHGELTVWIADFGDGTFAAGTEAAVSDVIDTREGDAEPFSGDLRDAYENADDGQMKVAVAVPEDLQKNATENVEEMPVDLDLPEIQVVTFVSDTDGTNATLAAQLTTDDEEGASELAGLVELARGFGGEMGNGEISPLLERLEVDQEGRHLTLRTTLSAGEIAELVEQFGAFDGATGSAMDSTSTDRQPSLTA